MGSVWLKESWIRWGPDSPREGAILGKGSPIVKHRDFMPWTVQKWLNRSICRLGCGLGLAEWSTSSIVFARWRQCAHMPMCPPCGHIGATWRIRLNRPSAAVMRSYVKLLWPLVLLDPVKLFSPKTREICLLGFTWPFVMVALWNTDHYIFILWFLSSYLSSSFFPRLISAVAHWMSTTLPHMVWP